jgi:hypothetical protein
LGYAEDEIGNSVAEWQNRVHPEDIQSALAEIDKHIRGEKRRFMKKNIACGVKMALTNGS